MRVIKSWQVKIHFAFWVALVLVAMAVFRIVGTMLIYEDAQVVIGKDLCEMANGQINGDACIVHADVSRDLVGATLLKLKDGRVLVFEHPYKGIQYSKSRYQFFKDWT